MKTWEVTTKENVDGQIITRKFEFDALDYPGARTRSWHLDGYVESIVNKKHPNEKYTDETILSWSSGTPPAPPVHPHKDGHAP